MAAYLKPIWDKYLEDRDLDSLRDDILTYPWYETPKIADESLLMRAVETSDIGATEMLLSLGENPLLPAPDGFSFLHEAVDNVGFAGMGHKRECDEIGPRREAALEVLKALLEAGADPNVMGASGTPLIRAAGSGVVESARMLLSYGADIEARMLVDGELTALMFAALMGHLQMVRFLLDSGAERTAMSSVSLTDPPMTLNEIVKSRKAGNVEEILARLNR